jgi:ribose transport system permease protein
MENPAPRTQNRHASSPLGAEAPLVGHTDRLRRLRQRAVEVREVGLIVAFALLCLVFALTSPVFLSSRNLLNTAQQVSLLGIMSVGMTFVLVSGEVDLSVGSTFGLSGMTAGLLMTTGHPIWQAVVAGLLVGLAVGLFNGLVTTYGRLPSFIVTLGTLSAVRGATQIVSNGLPATVDNTSVHDPTLNGFLFLGQGQLFGQVPIEAVFMVIIAILGGILLAGTTFGFRVYAVGSSARAARISGVNVARIKTASFVIMGVLAAVAGLLNLSFLQNVTPETGVGFELNVIAAVIIGGTSLAGGEGSVLGTLLGVGILGVLSNGLVLLGISPFWQTAFIGAVIITAVAIDRWLPGRSRV